MTELLAVKTKEVLHNIPETTQKSKQILYIKILS